MRSQFCCFTCFTLLRFQSYVALIYATRTAWSSDADQMRSTWTRLILFDVKYLDCTLLDIDLYILSWFDMSWVLMLFFAKVLTLHTYTRRPWISFLTPMFKILVVVIARSKSKEGIPGYGYTSSNMFSKCRGGKHQLTWRFCLNSHSWQLSHHHDFEYL